MAPPLSTLALEQFLHFPMRDPLQIISEPHPFQHFSHLEDVPSSSGGAAHAPDHSHDHGTGGWPDAATSPSMLFLMETYQHESTILSWKKKLNFDHVFVVDPAGQSSGGLALFWDNSVKVSSITSTHNWDFNEILWLHEKWGGLPQPRWRLNLFREFLSHTELSDLHFQGPDYTWFCIQNGRVVIKERLDRGLANNSWIAAKPCSQIFHVPKLDSDHRPILFDTSPPEFKAPHVFRFEHLWTSHPDSFQVVSSNWSTTPTTSASQTWEDNLKRCKSSLTTWASNTFPNFAKIVSSDTQMIQDILQSEQIDQPHVQDIIRQYFKDIYTVSPPSLVDEVLHIVDPVVISMMNNALLADISLDDVHQAVFELGALKAPGPDGFSGTFYQSYWDIVKDIVLKASAQTFAITSVLESFNCTHIALIPKVDVPQLATHFRPIALCNFAYKILTKIISNRLKPFMPDLISENQLAFVTGRQIHDNILMAHEMFHHLKLLRGGQGGEFALKLDMNKAYDRVDWDFLRLVMLKMGFHPTWVHLVLSCVTSASLAIIVNGALGRKFKPTRGIRQGDPLSPFLFLFINDVLSSMIRKICSNNLLDAVRIGVNGPLVSHLFFADDSIFFLKATSYNCEVLLETLIIYCSASGQSVNHQKSSLFFSPNTSQDVAQHISSILGMRAVLNPGRYLGLPTIWGRSKVSALSYVKVSIEKKISSWGQSSLSYANKETLIKSVALAVLAYPMTVFKFPVSLCNQINSSLANFWWGTSATKGRGSSPSWAWSSILEGRCLASAGSLWNIGSGTSVNLWKDNWIPTLRTFNLRTHSTPNDANRPVFSIIDRDTHSWNLTTIQSALPVETINAIQATTFGSPTNPDRLIWSAHSTGTYTSIIGVIASSITHCQTGGCVGKSLFCCDGVSLNPPSLQPPKHSLQQHSTRPPHPWAPPPVGRVKINTDAVWESSSLNSGIAVIARDSSGKLIGCSARSTLASSPLTAEAQAIALGLELAISLSHSSFQLESDSLVLISALLNTFSTVDWSASNIITQIRVQSGLFLRVNWLWSSRSANAAADLVAALAKCSARTIGPPILRPPLCESFFSML
ncbi:uncharacterized protein LOC133737340 [Rosa rugosa]|uniref:uncharacterized protein LOC133737340 n=1 Tax=Rosa rugosa TaxID=74645 RepID=UPI002B41518A|nr:uncharacterized protein LOC133737340 [Rosa rugosa]